MGDHYVGQVPLLHAVVQYWSFKFDNLIGKLDQNHQIKTH